MYTYSNDNTQLTLDTADPSRRFDNMLYNRAYMTMIDQCARGGGKHMTEEGYTNILLTTGRTLYLRDDETGKFFSAGWAPVCRDYASYRCTSGFNYQIIENVTDALKVTWRIYVPAGDDPIEIWDVRVADVSGRPRKVSLFTFAEMTCDGMDLYGGALYRFAKYYPQINGIFVRQDYVKHHEINFPWHNGFLAADRKADAWDAHKEKFIGPNRFPDRPITVEQGSCQNRHASMNTPTCTLQFRLAIPARGAQDTRMIIGGCDDIPRIQALRDTYLNGSLEKDPHFDALAAERAAMMKNIQLQTPEPSINTMLNGWTKQQIHYGAVWVRWGYKGYRDIVQQSQGILTQDAAQARKNLKRACEHQYSNGFALRGWHPLDTMEYADSAQWLISAITEYVKETGDFAFLDEDTKYLDKGSGTIYEHLMKAMIRLHTDRGPRGMCLAFFGDWNDSLTHVCKKGKGESVWLSMAFCRCAILMKELAERLGKKDDAARMAAWHAEMAQIINDKAWDGDWYICAIDDDGNLIGSKTNEEGKIFLNMQSWAQLGRVADESRFNRALAAVRKHLDSGWGLMLNWPTYTRPNDNIGRLTYLRPGICENGSVYTHGNAFMMLACLERGLADEALRIWRDIIPANPNRPGETQPNVFINGYYGPDSDIAPGRAEHAWVTGSASWMFMTVVEYMLGLRRTYDGLVIKPCLPSGWRNASITRIYRGTTYKVSISNPSGKQNPPVKSIAIDGKSHPVEKPLPIDGKEHEVSVVMG